MEYDYQEFIKNTVTSVYFLVAFVAGLYLGYLIGRMHGDG